MTPDVEQQLMAALERPHRLGMIGGELDEQLQHCLRFSTALAAMQEPSSSFSGADLGTGGGLPGLILALEFPGSQWTLIEMRAGRAAEVERAIHRLDLADRVTVAAEAAQRVAHTELREKCDVVVSRSFGPPSLTAECGAGLLRTGGHLLVAEPPTTDDDRWPEAGLTGFGLGTTEIFEYPSGRISVTPKITEVGADIPRLPPRKNRGWIHES